MNAKNWYKITQEFLQNTFGNDYKLFAGILAATSPQCTIQVNWNLACKIYHQIKAGKNPDLTSCMKNHKANVFRVLAGEQLSGNKVRNFYENLTGNLNAVTIDTWMLRLFGWYDRHTRKTPTDRQYKRLAGAFASLAQLNGCAPAEFQAIIWVYYRQKNGYEPTDFMSVGVDKRQYTFADLY